MTEYFVPGSYSFIKPEIIKKMGRKFPLMLNLEPTLACNLACFFCPSHNMASKKIGMRTAGMMKWDLYRKIIDESAQYGPLLVLNMHKDGESTLHPKFIDMIRYAKETKAAKVVHFNTNATMRKKEKIDEILMSGVDDITMSIDAFYPENYKKTKGVDLLPLVVENVEYFLEKRDSLGLKKPFIRAKMIGLKTKENEEEFRLFKEYWTPKTDEVQCQEVHNFAGGLDFSRINQNRYPCEFPFYSTAVNWNGTITICHRDFNNKDVFGNVFEQSIREIYLGEKYQSYLQAMIKGKEHTLPICAGCDNWKDGPDLGADLTTKLNAESIPPLDNN
jgi:MoaA/NifB/PqqE/SkfB family radical SAM enzyme